MIICLYCRGILGMECTICIIYIVFGPQGPLIEPSIPSTRPPTTIFLFLLLLLILLSPPPSPWGGLLLLLLLQMIIRRDHPLANDDPDWPAVCKWSTGWPAFCKWSTGGTGLLQMIIRINQILLHFSFYSAANLLFLIGAQTKLIPIVDKDKDL